MRPSSLAPVATSVASSQSVAAQGTGQPQAQASASSKYNCTMHEEKIEIGGGLEEPTLYVHFYLTPGALCSREARGGSMR